MMNASREAMRQQKKKNLEKTIFMMFFAFFLLPGDVIMMMMMMVMIVILSCRNSITSTAAVHPGPQSHLMILCSPDLKTLLPPSSSLPFW